ncbi:hypothetical protein [Paenibacillus sp. ACRRY]|jgi:hypothetical protein|uniref:phage tail assembly chaperone n=1 Tax=Paenibacillus sp. ACRRY TaxID=2918208 RepID=UPI001EF572AB|nr:hypothetical protein [Paenibacillus sp. ACRRY]MCG7386874.1 hypothetical protein [Paenibacillus sp. ACRRY]
MAKGLDALLGAQLEVTDEVYIPRLKAKLTVKSLTNAELERVRLQATVGKNRELNDDLYNNLIIVQGCVDPDFSNKALLAHYGATDAADCVHKAILPGERAKLIGKILDLSGFGADEEEELEEAKN